MRRKLLLLAVLPAFVIGACETTQKRIEKNHAYFQSLPVAHQRLIRQNKITLGFAPKEVYLAWGRPGHKAITESSRGRLETWIYTRTRSETYYRPVRRYNKKTDAWVYVDEPYYIHREYVTKDVVFVRDQVDEWTVYSNLLPYDGYLQN